MPRRNRQQILSQSECFGHNLPVVDDDALGHFCSCTKRYPQTDTNAICGIAGKCASVTCLDGLLSIPGHAPDQVGLPGSTGSP